MDLADAIRQRRIVTFVYDGCPRVVQPAAYGRHRTTDKLSLRGYQIDGASNSRTPPLWDLFTVEKIQGLRVTDETFPDDPPLYRRGDKQLHVIVEL